MKLPCLPLSLKLKAFHTSDSSNLKKHIGSEKHILMSPKTSAF